MIKIMLVDDYPVFRQGLSILLKNNFNDFEVIGEASGEVETIDKVGRLRPDVVIIDVVMHNGDGIETTRLIHEKFPEVKLLVLSVSDEEEQLFQAIKAGASSYLLKTADLAELAGSIRAAASGQSILSPSLISKLIGEFRNDRSEDKQHLYVLTPREKEVLQLAAIGSSNKEIAGQCYISLTTVKAHFRNILGKLEAKNRTGAVALANAYGLLDKPGKTSAKQIKLAANTAVLAKEQ
ncbi:MAG: response regulator transcription factor [Dehalococcoidales bacterium]|nr:response regulator transcription factor [Dehalococcoidales bacterium]